MSSRLLLLSASPQSFAPIIENNFSANEIASNPLKLFLIPLENSTNILCIFYNQILVISSIDLAIKDEILLEGPVLAFKFLPTESSLTIKIAMNSDTSLNNSITTITSRKCSWSLECPNHTFTLKFTEEGLTSCCFLSSNLETFVYNQIKEVIKGDHIATIVTNQNQKKSKLQILLKSDRSLVSSVNLNLNQDHHQTILGRSLIWSGKEILIFTISLENGLKVLKFPFVHFSTSTNGCNLPLIAWCQEQIYVHRAGAICPTWFKLNNSVIWDFLDSHVGQVEDVCVSLDGSCLLVFGENGVALCDFLIRNWRALPFPKLIYPKWIGSGHVVALTPDRQQLILISRNNSQSTQSQGIMKIILDFPPETINFIDTYNNWQILIQHQDKVSIFAFDSSSIDFKLKFIKSFNYSHDYYSINDNSMDSHINNDNDKLIKQAAMFQEKLFVLDIIGNFWIYLNDGQCVKKIFKDCESFLVLSTGHLLILTNKNSSEDNASSNEGNTSRIFLLKEEIITPIHGMKSPLGILPFINCFTALFTDDLNFSLNTQIQSQFLLPDLFLAESQTETDRVIDSKSNILLEWSEDPLYPLALEYVILKVLKTPKLHHLLEIIDGIHANNNDKKLNLIISRALVGLVRKIEVIEASQLFKFLPNFSPLQVTENLLNSKSFEESLNFLPYLAKSYFESHNERKESIKSILSFIFSHRKYFPRISKVKEYLSAFVDLEELFQFTLCFKIQELWKSGRIFKAFQLIKEAENLNIKFYHLEDLIKNDSVVNVMRLDLLNDNGTEIRNWLLAHNLSETVHCLDSVK